MVKTAQNPTSEVKLKKSRVRFNYEYKFAKIQSLKDW